MLWNEGTIEKMICDIAACTDTRIVAVDIGGKILSASDDYWDMRSEMLLRLIARYIESQKEEVLETSVLIEEEEGSKAIKEIVVKGNTEGFSITELPNIQSEKGLRLWREEIIRLKDYLEEKFQVVITDDDVKRAIRVENRRRSALKRLYEVMKFDPVPIMGMDLFNVLYGSKYRLDKEQAAEDINRLTDRILDEYKPDAGQKRRPRILVTGCPIGGDSVKIVRAIEDNGGVVVAFENCTGAKVIDKLVDEDEPDIYGAIARKYFYIGCAIMTPNDNRIELLGRMID